MSYSNKSWHVLQVTSAKAAETRAAICRAPAASKWVWSLQKKAPTAPAL
ncbi:hypothetical protein AB0C29_41425 [Actinoplanes sp. NPDC048791]